MPTAEKEKPVEKKPVEKSLELELAATIVSGILAGPNVSHQEFDVVAKLAVKHARALMRAVDEANA